jgi:hypothetical protein
MGLLQQQLDETRQLLVRARDLFGTRSIAPPESMTAPKRPSPGATIRDPLTGTQLTGTQLTGTQSMAAQRALCRLEIADAGDLC